MFLKSFKKVLPLLLIAILLASVANVFLISVKQARAASTGPNDPGTMANDTSVGTVTWNFVNDAKTQNDTYAIASASGQTNYLKATNFSFSIPTGAVIDGIVVEVDRYFNGVGSMSDTAVRIVKGGTIGSTDKSAAGNWATSDTDTYTTYGSSSDKWGETWTESDIEGSTFGFVLSGTVLTPGSANVDHIRITVYYTPSGGGGGGGGIPTGGSPDTGIKVELNTIGGEGTFNFLLSGLGFSNFNITTDNGYGFLEITGLAPGYYSVNETVPDGWTKTQDNCSDITLIKGKITTCQIENTKTNATPSVTSIDPSSAYVNSDSFTLTVNGSNLIPDSLVRWAGSDKQTTYVLSTQLTAQIPAFDLTTTGNKSITVKNPGNPDLMSNEVTFVVLSNPRPSIDNISPSSATVNSNSFTLTVNGSNFIKSSVVRWAGSNRTTTYISSTQLTAQIPASDLTRTGNNNITVNNPSPGGGNSNTVVFNVTPSTRFFIKSISPSSAAVNSEGFTLTVNGGGFRTDSIVRWAGSNRQTKYISSSKLEATVPASDLTKAGNKSITVRNPNPKGVTSNAVTFTVGGNPSPSIKSIKPSSEFVNSPSFTLEVNGGGFISSSVVRWAGSNRTTTYISSTQLTAQIPASDLTTTGNNNITVNNPSPGGGNSNTVVFNVVANPKPSIQSISPSLANIGSSDITLTVNGGGFIPASVIQWNGEGQTTTYVSSTKLTADISADKLSNLGTYVVTVENPNPGGGLSNSVNFLVRNPTVFEKFIDIIIDAGDVVNEIISEVIVPVVETTIEGAKVATEVLRENVETPVGSVATKVITTTGVAIAVPAAVFIPSFSLSEIFLTPIRLWGLLLSLLGIRKKTLPWGVVYDSQTKQPLDPAYVILKDQKDKEVATAITDIDGRYGFLTQSGIYTILARKTNYAFPSTKITSDSIYDNLYFGGAIEITKKGQVLSKNIPLDPLKFDWNEFAKRNRKFMKFYSRWDKIIRRLSEPSFVVGFVVSTLVLLLAPRPYNMIIFSCYIGLLLLKGLMRALGIQPKATGYITDKKTGDPLSFAVLKIFSPTTNTQISQKIADKYGRYYCLVPKGRYFVKVEKKNPDGSYSEIYTSTVINALRNGIIKESFKV